VLNPDYVAAGEVERLRWLPEGGAGAAPQRLVYAEQFSPWNWLIVGEMSTVDIAAFIRRELTGQIPILILLTLMLSVVLITTLRRLVLSDIDGLIAVATELQGGQLSARAQVRPSEDLGRLASAFNTMASGIQDRDEEIQSAQRATVYALAKLADSRDSETGGHLLRVREYSRILAEQLRKSSQYWSDIIDDQFVSDLSDAVMLHDIGKVGIPDYILLKPETLSEAEMAIMMSHTLIGANTIRAAQERMRSHSSFLALAEEITRSHHERWDGSGYLERLAGDDIPPAARIFTVADVYDALTSERSYKKAFTHQEAIEQMRRDSGRRFDPSVFDAFLSVEHEFDRIRREFEDR
jgi:response regulator RpfG family c-di-GMP phosphodiesterase